MAKPNSAGQYRKNTAGKGTPRKGTGGHGRKALEGKGPTPKAEDRAWHVAGKRKAAKDRLDAARARISPNAKRPTKAPKASPDKPELVTGRNSVLEALRARIPASTLYLAARAPMDDRVREALSLANKRQLPVLEVLRSEIDRLVGPDAVHQGIALAVPPYEYAHPLDLLHRAQNTGEPPLLLALDGVTDPRNLGAIIRSAAAFGAHGVIVPKRRSVGMSAAAWKTSAGAAARVPVALASNLNQTLTTLKAEGVFVVGLDGAGDTPLSKVSLADLGLVLVVGSEGRGLSRLVSEGCDAIASIPISANTESLNAGVAAAIALYEFSKLRTSTRK